MVELGMDNRQLVMVAIMVVGKTYPTMESFGLWGFAEGELMAHAYPSSSLVTILRPARLANQR